MPFINHVIPFLRHAFKSNSFGMQEIATTTFRKMAPIDTLTIDLTNLFEKHRNSFNHSEINPQALPNHIDSATSHQSLTHSSLNESSALVEQLPAKIDFAQTTTQSTTENSKIEKPAATLQKIPSIST